MTAINFGTGTAIARRSDISNPTPSWLGILQDIEIDFDQTLKELIGAQKFAVDVAPAALKITGKAKFARIEGSIMRDLLFGSAATTTLAAGLDMIQAEIKTSAAGFTATQAATYKEDLGVFYAATGVQLTRVPSGVTTGNYIINEATGVYTLAAGDNGTNNIVIYYSYGVTTLVQNVITNTNMGTGSTFEMHIAETYINNAGVTNKFNLKLNACRASKLAMPFKNTDYTVEAFDFQAFADQSGTVGTLSTTE